VLGPAHTPRLPRQGDPRPGAKTFWAPEHSHLTSGSGLSRPALDDQVGRRQLVPRRPSASDADDGTMPHRLHVRSPRGKLQQSARRDRRLLMARSAADTGSHQGT
jgi:hypothetical protein